MRRSHPGWEDQPVRRPAPAPADGSTHPGPGPRRRPVRVPAVERIAHWSARHRAAAICGWLAFVVVAIFVGQLVAAGNVPSYDPGEAGRAERTLHALGADDPAVERVLIQADAPDRFFATDAELRAATAAVATALHGLPAAATQIHSALDPDGSSLISADGRSALVTFEVPGDAQDADDTVGPAQDAVTAVQAAHPDLRIEEVGDATVDKAVNSTITDDLHNAELTSVPVTLVLLLLIFGTLMAAGIPVLLAGSAVVAVTGLLAIPGHWLPVDQQTTSVVLLVGMAVGVDYSLFYLRREREARAAGQSTRQAIGTAAATSGRAILISGLTVMASLAGLFFSGTDVFGGMAVGTMLVVGVAVAGSLTVLPALLATLGARVDRGRVPFLGRRRAAAARSRIWEAVVGRVVRSPVVFGIAAVALLAVLATPALSLRTQDPGEHLLPADTPIVVAMDHIQAAFPGGPDPAEIVVTGPAVTASGPAAARLEDAVAALRSKVEGGGDGLFAPVTARLVGGGRALVVTVGMAGDGSDAASTSALEDLRTRLLPDTLGRVPGASYAVDGAAASSHDFATVMRQRTPLVLGLVAALALVLMLLAFRSPALAVTTVLLNLLSVAAALGVTTWVFQDGHLHGVLDFQPYGGITTWVPLFMFVILFGLSMDYHVFVVSRIREVREAGADNATAIRRGIGASAGVVTSAAVIMAAVFSIFATMDVITMKMLGVGMATAVLVDATVVRGVLIPAVLGALGDRAWYRPRWLDRLPGGSSAATSAAVQGAGAPVDAPIVGPVGGRSPR